MPRGLPRGRAITRRKRSAKRRRNCYFYVAGSSAGVPGGAAEGVRAATADDAGEVAVSLGIRMERGAECGLGEHLRFEGREGKGVGGRSS